ncbi:MAG: hypothetical protein WD425_17210 [Nitrospirales bacterium]
MRGTKSEFLRVPSQLTSFVWALGERLARPFWENLVGALAFCVTMVILAIWSTNLPNWQDIIVSEHGPVERMSAGVWFMATVWCLAAGGRYSPYRIEWLGLTTLFLLFGLRELDAQVWATGWNLEKLANYWNPRVPLWERLLVMGFMIIPTMAVGAVLCSRIGARLSEAWHSRAPWIAQMTVGGILLGFCLLFDKVGAYYLPFLGLEGAQLLFMVMEEFGEYVLAVYTVSVLWPYWQEAFSSNGTGS